MVYFQCSLPHQTKLTAASFSFLVACLALIEGAAKGVEFEKDIEPILRSKCFKCHSGPKSKAGLRMDDVETLKKKIGTDEDSPIHPGEPLKSLLVQKASLPRSDTDAMPPPRRGDPLTTIELAMIKKWIEEGASLEPSEPDGTEPTAPAVDMNKLYDWTNTEGKSLKAGFVKLDGKTVFLKKEDGSEFSYPMSSLSAESRRQASELSRL